MFAGKKSNSKNNENKRVKYINGLRMCTFQKYKSKLIIFSVQLTQMKLCVVLPFHIPY